VEPDLDLVAKALGAHPTSLVPAAGGGYTRSGSWIAETADGLAFVKQAEEAGSLSMLRREAVLYEGVRAGYLPGFRGFADDGTRAVLAVEAIVDGYWPPPYRDDVSLLFDALDDVASTKPPDGLPRVEPWGSRWQAVGAEPGPFLSLGLCSAAWLEVNLERLVDAELASEWMGDALVHNDVYSGNVCFARERVLLVDWGVASIGSRWVDVAFALVSVRSEGGPPLAVTLPGAAGFAACLAGHWATEAPKPLPAWAEPGSTLREDMAQDLRAALAWAVEELELPPLR
jgi:hypothetical protein